MHSRQDWFIRVPWGELALVAHGHPDGPPVLMVHGRQDSSSVFEPLVQQMTEKYYFVELDMPGNGLSDAFPPVLTPALRGGDPNYAVVYNKPPQFFNEFLDYERYTQGLEYTKGPKLMRFHFLSAMELAIQHLGWDKFIFMGHSMGCEQGLFYSVIHPGQITKMILLDAGPTLMRMQVQDHLEYQRYYDSYYENYTWENFKRKPYTKDMALKTLQRHRDLTRSQSEVLLSRNFHRFPLHSLQNSKESLNEDDGLNAVYQWNPNRARNAEESPSTDGSERTLVPLGSEKSNGSDRSKGSKNTNVTQNEDQEHSVDLAPTLNEPGDLRGRIQRLRDDDDTLGYLSWDNRLKNLAPQNYGNDYYFALFKTIPPTLLIAASDGAKNVPPNPKWRQGAKELLERMATLDNFHRVDVEGGHDVHFTHPERVIPYINAFLKDSKVFSKL